jgi:putative FmdB family regulatory protein
MPLYEYKCDACGKHFEKIQKFSDPLETVCPHCGKGPVHKQISSPAIQFKGSGWYITDYAKKSSAAAGDSKETKDSTDGSKESKDSNATSSTSETKAAATDKKD